MLNRELAVVTLMQPFVDWINAADPGPRKFLTTLADANEDRSAFLIPQGASEAWDVWLEHHYLLLFERVLEEWYVDETLWPQDRNFKLFSRWCAVDVHSLVIDLVDDLLIDDEIDELVLEEDFGDDQ